MIVVVAVGVALLLSRGGGEDTTVGHDDVSSTVPPATATSDTPPPDDDRPEVPPIACASLLTQDEIADALGVWERDDPPGSFRLAMGETCGEQIDGEEDFFVTIGPGELTDFVPGTRLNTLEGEPVAGVWDGATWFGHDDGAGTLAVYEDTPLGVLVFRVGVGRPDLDDAARLGIARALAASALPRFPGVEVEAEITPVESEPEPVDQSFLGYVGNLAAKEADGEWTHGEGLVATLQLLVGDADPADVLRHPDIPDPSAAGVLALARDYLESDADSARREEVADLLDRLLVPHEVREAVVRLRADPEDRSAEDALRSPPPAAGRVVRSAVAQGAECGPFSFPYLGGCAVDYAEGNFSIYGPEPDTHGWSQADIDRAIDALFRTAELYVTLGEMTDIVILLGEPGGVDTLDVELPDVHFIEITAPVAGDPPTLIDQRIALQMAYSTILTTFDPQSAAQGLDNRQWWADGLALYLSGTASPSVEGNQFHPWVSRMLAGVEAGASLFEQGYATALFFEYLHSELGGPQGLFALIRNIPPLEGIEGIAEHWQRFNQLLTNRGLRDQHGNIIRFEAPFDYLAVMIDPHSFTRPMAPFSVYRILIDPLGEPACVTVGGTGVRFSHGGAQKLDDEFYLPFTNFSSAPVPTDISDGPRIFVVTAVSDDASFTLTTRAKDDGDCPDHPEDPPGRPPQPESSCDLDLVCGPSLFFYLRSIAEALIPGFGSSD